MRLVAMCVAGLLLMQLPATASIVSSSSHDLEAPARWNVAYGYLAWDSARGVFRFSADETGQGFEGAELLLATEVFPRLSLSGLELSAPGHWAVSGDWGFGLNARGHDLTLFASLGNSTALRLESLDLSATKEEEAYANNIRIAATSVCPEPATLTIWGVSALALAAATYRRQRRAGRINKRVQAAVQEYLEACTSPADHFRLLGSRLTTLADDPSWTKQDVEAFYDEVVVALHRRREHAEVA
jgi:hypothetical protein